eukprot:CAMPEP_0203992914 /NCGR_PEP_ID=MMETSP0360-20130528/10397_1 /ASSEMBLY_ACC=CAM_ASM_000342 /TAXON_ID=268821 /ORGANISM="Scrippsiella Hangoei, Strain SHTV-5" /LENGTH=40 /DNA_ID= /DNA_START= /DNA_END= /DNA_ORIENTATION=
MRPSSTVYDGAGSQLPQPKLRGPLGIAIVERDVEELQPRL